MNSRPDDDEPTPAGRPGSDSRAAEDAVRQLAEDVAAAGGRAYLVGGCVRDALLGLGRTDFDVEVFGVAATELEALVSRRFRWHDVGRSYGVLKLDGLPIDVSLPRRETKVAPGHRGFAVDTDPSLTVAEAALRRDLTVNALYEDPRTGEIEDPTGGLQDLHARVLRHCSPRFAEDPLRVLRLAQFSARLGFEVATETVALCRTLDLEELPRERIEAEWRKLLEAPQPGRGFRTLRACEALRAVPELARRTAAELDTLAGALERLPVASAAVHLSRVQLGWTLLAHFVDAKEGENAAESLLERLCGRVREIREALLLTRTVRALHAAGDDAREVALRRIAVEHPLGAALAVQSCYLTKADGDPESLPLWTRAKQLGVLHESPAPLLQGRDLLALGASPGKALGQLLEELFHRQLAGDLRTREEALQLARTLISAGNDPR